MVVGCKVVTFVVEFFIFYFLKGFNRKNDEVTNGCIK